MTDYKMEAETGKFEVKMSDKVDFKIKRGEESWKYIYTILGFMLTIEGTIVSMFSISAICKILLFFITIAVTSFLFFESSKFQNILFSFKSKMEEKLR